LLDSLLQEINNVADVGDAAVINIGKNNEDL